MTTHQLKIKTGVLQRLIKEEKFYHQELIEQTIKLESLSSSKPLPNDDDYEWKLRKQKEVIEETKKMIPDAQLRLSKSLAELQELVAAHEEEWADTEELAKAKGVIDEGQKAVDQLPKS
ncbi:hypothetical protein CROQUDRAFT_669116 [Cronartium quercuum f. sp. fusiforme G11]|uniref:Tubulin-specific chaperone A n=1 Tax=Cronartium quercuum f. sp. fusiforme G11 TaxID=708437 RepID=A0A9P6NM23_9BASI|nr:hypothetical protein CROQUDRAFT_669116 [Cronartium quercuum f. sp. fusiforme G11]